MRVSIGFLRGFIRFCPKPETLRSWFALRLKILQASKVSVLVYGFRCERCRGFMCNLFFLLGAWVGIYIHIYIYRYVVFNNKYK